MKPLHERRRRSARETFSKCPHRYKVEYLDGVDMSSSASRRGSAWHRAKELYIRALWQARQTDDLDAANAAISQALTEQPLPLPEEIDVRDLWMRFIERFRLPLDQYWDVETDMPMFSTLLRFDLVLVPRSDTLLIEDSKTNWHIPSESALRDSYQARFYLAAARFLFPNFAHYRIAFIFERFNERIEFELSPAEMDAFEQTISDSDDAMAAAEESGVFPAYGGAHCGSCMADCPLVGVAMRMPLERLQSPQDASACIGALAALHRRQAALRQAIQGYVDASGQAAEAGGVSWDYRPVEMRRYPAGQLIKTLADAGFETEAGKVSVSGSSVKRFVTSKGKYRQVEDAIKALAVTKVSTQFGPRIASLEDDAPLPEDE